MKMDTKMMVTEFQAQAMAGFAQMVKAYDDALTDMGLRVTQLEREIQAQREQNETIAQENTNLHRLFDQMRRMRDEHEQIRKEFLLLRSEYEVRVVPEAGESYITADERQAHINQFNRDDDEEMATFKGVVVGSGQTRWLPNGQNVDHKGWDLKRKKV